MREEKEALSDLETIENFTVEKKLRSRRQTYTMSMYTLPASFFFLPSHLQRLQISSLFNARVTLDSARQFVSDARVLITLDFVHAWPSLSLSSRVRKFSRDSLAANPVLHKINTSLSPTLYGGKTRPLYGQRSCLKVN